ncbi:ProQ/FINO family protein [Halomonas halodenitrificans]|uniref:ProQ/FINO family protein n=1 Tax=Halomonas halodenitrificans TaxID=28252 RepID=UPI000A03AEB2|nr:ProQ/FINO family protein [Halomonas halodenitrificans]
MAEQRVDSLLDALDGRTRSLLERLAHEREARRHAENVQAELAQRLGELERRLAEAEANRLELEEERRNLSEKRRELSDKCREMNEKCLELQEECRELDEQNGELEAHSRHLQQRLESGEPAENGFRPGRRSQGLSALIGRRAEPADSHSDDSGQPSRRSAIYRAMDDTPSPVSRTSDTSDSYKGAAPEAEATVSPDTSAACPTTTPAAPATAPSPQALLGQWYQRYPTAFFKGHTRPLMVGIHEVLASHEPWPEKLVRRALACYVNLPRYLKAMRKDAERIDLDGQPAGKVDAQAADYAHRKLDRLQSGKPASQGRGKPARAAGQEKGKPKKGQGGGTRQAARKPAPEQAEPAPATMEEKLSALMAKHNEP